jgi:hypothetical protein
MPLVIDSSPAASTTSAQANASTAFTPPDNSLIIALWAGNTGSVDPLAPSKSSSPAQTWTTDAWDHKGSGTPSLDGQAAFFHALVGTAPGSTVLTVTNGHNTAAERGSILKPYVLTGHDLVTPIANANGTRQNGGSTLTVSYTATIDGGQGFMVVSDWQANSTSAWAAASGCTIVNKGTLAGEISYAVVQRTDPDDVAGFSTSLGITGLPAGGLYHIAYASVVSAEAGAAARGSQWTQQQQYATASNW